MILHSMTKLAKHEFHKVVLHLGILYGRSQSGKRELWAIKRCTIPKKRILGTTNQSINQSINESQNENTKQEVLGRSYDAYLRQEQLTNNYTIQWSIPACNFYYYKF
jgi:hypothetical protein